jgi:hypothetical protein
MPKHYEVVKRNATSKDGWTATVSIKGKQYNVSVSRGNRVRIAFKRRGENYGFKWWGAVRATDGSFRYGPVDVAKNTGLVALLESAGLVPLRQTEMDKLHHRALWVDHCRDYRLQRELEDKIRQDHMHALMIDARYNRDKARSAQ